MSKSKQEIIDERKANLPLPDDPPEPRDLTSADARTVNVGSGSVDADITAAKGGDSLRGPATAESAVRTDSEEYGVNTQGLDVGRTAKDGLGGLPNDAVTRDKKDKAGLDDTTGEDYGYPQKSDPSSGLKK